MLQMGNDPEEVQRLREDWIEQGGALPNAVQPQQDQVADGSASQARRVAVLTHALKDNA